MLGELGKANGLDKVRQQPDKVRMVLDKVRADGLVATVEAVQSKLDQPLAPGYCNVGRVAELGLGLAHIAVRDQVGRKSQHPASVSVPHQPCARVPASVSNESAASTVRASIG